MQKQKIQIIQFIIISFLGLIWLTQTTEQVAITLSFSIRSFKMKLALTLVGFGKDKLQSNKPKRAHSPSTGTARPVLMMAGQHRDNMSVPVFYGSGYWVSIPM